MLRKLILHYKQNFGFTLVELMVVITIVGILTAAVLPSYRNFVARGRDQQRLAGVNTIQQALEQYYTDNAIYPANTDFTISSTAVLAKGTKTYLDKTPTDPSPTNPQYNYVAQPVGCDNGTIGLCLSYCLYVKLEQSTYAQDVSSCTNDPSYNLEVTVLSGVAASFLTPYPTIVQPTTIPTSGPTPPGGSNPYPTWYYRAPITLTNSLSQTLTDYQVNFTLNTASLVSVGRMKSDCSDLRVGSLSQSYSYWIQSGCNTTTTSIWAKVNNIPVGNSTLYAFYGNSTATTASSGPNTFILFDEFGSLDTTIWPLRDPHLSVLGGRLQGSSTTGESGDWYWESKSFPATNGLAVDVDQQAGVLNGSDGTVIQAVGTSGNGYSYSSFDANRSFVVSQLGGSCTNSGTGISDINTQELRLAFAGNNLKGYRTNIVKAETSSCSAVNMTKIRLGHNDSSSTNSATSYLDSLRVRKYATALPTASSVGAEEINSTIPCRYPADCTQGYRCQY